MADDDELTRSERRAAQRRQQAENGDSGATYTVVFWLKVVVAIAVGFGAVALIVSITSQGSKPEYVITKTGENFGITAYVAVVNEWPNDKISLNGMLIDASDGEATYLEVRCGSVDGTLLASATIKSSNREPHNDVVFGATC